MLAVQKQPAVRCPPWILLPMAVPARLSVVNGPRGTCTRLAGIWWRQWALLPGQYLISIPFGRVAKCRARQGGRSKSTQSAGRGSRWDSPASY